MMNKNNSFMINDRKKLSSMNKANRIHSGHFMVSEIDENDNEHNQQSIQIQKQSTLSQTQKNASSRTCQIKRTLCLEMPSNTAKSSKKVSIDQTLWKLLQCMTLAYHDDITSPKWKTFKGLQMNIKDKIRLNNIIWRAWHIQYNYGRKPSVCRFSSNIDTDRHKKTESILLEGKYWKRKVDVIKAEYNKWRLYYQHVSHRTCQSIDDNGANNCNNVINVNNHNYFNANSNQNHISNNQNHSNKTPYDWEKNLPRWTNNLSFDSLFSTTSNTVHSTWSQPNDNSSTLNDNSHIANNPITEINQNHMFNDNNFSFQNCFDYANSREIARSGMGADFMQPVLEQLQPNIDFIDQFEQDFFTSLRNNPLSTVAEVAETEQRPGDILDSLFDSTILSNKNDNEFSSKSLQNNAFIQYTNNHSASDQSINNVIDNYQQQSVHNSPNSHSHLNVFQSVAFKMDFESNMNDVCTNNSINNNQSLPSTILNKQTIPQKHPSTVINNFDQINNLQPTTTINVDPKNQALSGQNLSFTANNQTSSINPLLSLASNSIDYWQHQQHHSSANINKNDQHKHISTYLAKSSFSDVQMVPTTNSTAFEHQQQRFNPLSSSSSSSSSPQQQTQHQSTSSLMAFDLSNSMQLQNNNKSNDNQKPCSSLNRNLINKNLMISNQSSPLNYSNFKDRLLSGKYCHHHNSTNPCSNSNHSNNVNEYNNHSNHLYRERRRVCHINAEQKRRCNIKNGFDTLRSLLPTLSNNSQTKISKASMLHKAADYIRILKNEEFDQQNKLDTLKQQINQLNDVISHLQNQLPTSGQQMNDDFKIENFKQKYFDYVQQKINQNWKFWILSIIIESSLLDSYCKQMTANNFDELNKTLFTWLDQNCNLPTLRKDVLNSLRFISTSTNILTNPELLENDIKKTSTILMLNKCQHAAHQQLFNS